MRIALAAIRLDMLGGKERDFLAVGTHLASRGHDVTLLTASAGAAKSIALPVQRMAARSLSNHGRAASFARSVAALGGAQKADAVIAFDKLPGADFYYAADICLARRPLGVRRWLPRYRTLLALERGVFAPAAATHIFYLTRHQQHEYQEAYGTPEGRGTLLPVILHPDRLAQPPSPADRAILRRQLSLPPDATLAVTVATKPETKGVDRVLGVLPRLPALHYLVIGSDDAGIGQMASRLGVSGRVHRMPYVENIMPALAGADLMLHPARVEAGGLVIVESLLAGLPVVVSAACGYAPEVERSGAGVVVPEPFRSDALLAGIHQALANIETMTAKARDYAVSLRRTESWLAIVTRVVEAMGASARHR